MLFPKFGKYIIIFFAIAFIITGIRGYQLYMYAFRENTKTDYVLIIPEDATYRDVYSELKSDEVLYNYKAFSWVSKKKNYPEHIKPGRYRIEKGMNTNQIINKLVGGLQDPVNVTFNNIRFNEDLAGRISKYLQADSVEILGLFQDTALIKEYGFTPETFRAMFIPNTYEFYWTTTAKGFADRMKKEYEQFWTKERLQKAKAINLTPAEVITLASIVQAETSRKDELQRVAGLYINRLK
ncbi:MAG: endolytic transglycosylase MltG, partial [Prolixibacteraceae bacterium]